MIFLLRILAAISLLTIALAQQDSLALTDQDCTEYFRNETFTDSPWLWRGHITNFNYDLFFELNPDLLDPSLPVKSQNITQALIKASSASRVRPTEISYPLAVSYHDAVFSCGATPGFYEWPLISDTLTTWILPLFGLIVSLPWESNRRGRTILMIFRWIGSPFATLTYIFWNLRAIGRAATLADMGIPRRHPRDITTQPRGSSRRQTPQLEPRGTGDEEAGIGLNDVSHAAQQPAPEGGSDQATRASDDLDLRNEKFCSVRDSFALLCVMNQYKLSSDLTISGQRVSESDLRAKIVSALFLNDDTARKPGLVKCRTDISVEIRRFRKRGIVPVLLSLAWYFFALGISMYKAFGDVGDNATAHNLALGLLMGWLPVLVASAIIDRNTVDSEHVVKLLNQLMEIIHGEKVTFTKFVGQGRRRWHYGVAHPILKMLEDYWSHTQTAQRATGGHSGPIQRTVNWADVANRCLGDRWPGYENGIFSINYFSRWEFVHMVAAWLTLGMSVLGAWYISYNTPTVGLGCRSFSYAMFLVVCTFTGLVELGLYPIIYRPVREDNTAVSPASSTASSTADPRHWFKVYIRSKKFRGRMNVFLWGLEIISTLILFTTVFMQTTGAFQFFWCRASLFGHRGGYIIFDTVVYIKQFFDAKKFWMIGAILSSVVPGLGTAWALREWLMQSFLWSNDVGMARRGLGRVRSWKGFWWWIRFGGRLRLKWIKGGVGWRP
ncbi:hypothetical protein TWF481_012259 [Arthrobotrys musiformis]|uniref:Integral membrane protein n=1 Tax=Arthrobotrys musiformis TaxID=47236 RepID=A0AAV9VWK7_9PEZI